MLLVEIYSLSSSSDFTSSHQWPGNDESVVRVFFKAMMEFSLFACSLGRVSSTCPTIQSIKKYLELTKDQAMIIFDKLCVKKSNTEFVLEELYWLLQKELGFDIKDEKMYFRIAMTVSDASRSDRICFLLDHCRVALLKSSGDLPIVVTRLLKLVFETLYLCSAPGVIKSCSGVIEAINTNKLVAKTSTNSYLNSFRTICHQKLYLQNTGTTKGISIIPPQTSVDVIDMKPINGFLNDSIEPSLMAMIVAKMGQMMEPGSEIEESISVKDMWKIPYMSMNNKPASAASPAMSTYRVILHQANEINFVNLLKVMYHLDQKFDLLNHQALETWAKYKEKAKQKGLKPKKPPVPDLSSGPEGVPYETYHYKLFETTIEGIPASSISTPAEEAELPIGWYLGALRKFQDLEGPKKEKKYIDKRKVNKTWNLNHISSISDRVRDALDKLPEPKEDATEEAKAKFVAEYNALSRYSDLCIYVHSVGQMLNKFGFSVIPIKGSLEQVEKIVIALEAAFQGKIKPISYDNFSTEVKNILNHKDAKETQTDSKPESMAISIINVGIYYHLKDNFEKVYPLNYGNNKINEGLNHNSFLTIAMPTGATTSHYISKVSEVLRKLILNPKSTEGAILSQIVNKSIQAMKDANISAMPDMDRYLVMGSLSLVSGWEGSLITGSDVKLKNSENVRDLAVIKVPQNSGKLASVLINNSDENVSTQFVNYSQIQKKPEEKNSIVATLDIQSLLDSYLKIESQIEEMQKSPNVNIASKEFNPVKWSGLVSLQLSSCLMLQMLFRHPNIKECLANKVPEVLLAKAKKSLGTPSNRLIFRTFIAWEGLVDKFSKLSTLISNPKPPQPLNIAPELDDLVMKDKIVPKDLKNLKPAASKEPSSYRLPASSYIECLPRSNPKSSNYKMVKYWEKHIIPKIENFVRSSFKQFEMDEFFEQLRIELRVLDHTKACVIAFKLCDGGLPNGCVPPDADYDWETIDIEDIEVGSLVCTKLEYRNSVISEKVKHLVDLGLEEVVSEVLIVDHQSKYVLVLIRDDNAMQSLTLWVPQQCIKPIEYPVHRQGHSMSYSEHFEELNKRISEFQTYLSQNILIKSLSLRDGLSDKIDSYQAIKWTVISELNNNLISGWLEFESQLQSEKSNENLISRLMRKEPTKLHKLECDLQVLCKNEVPIDYLINCINTEAKEIVKLLNDNFVCLNLKDKIETDQGQAKHISPLNLFTQIGAPENSVAAIAVTFDKKAYLGVTSGVKFYGDNKGLHLVNHILNNQKDLSLSNIPPILFQSNEIYYQFYSSVEGVPLWSRNLIVSDLPCVVHGIPYSWTPCCWLIDTLSTILAKQEDGRWTEKINQLLKTTINLSQEIKGPTIIKQMLYKLSTRLSRKIKLLARRKPELFADKIKGTEARIEKLYGLEPEITQMLHNELKTVLDIEKDSILPSDKFPLYSSYTQDLLELLATICSPFKIGSTELTPDPNIAIPEKLADLVNFSNLAEYFKAKEFLSTTNLKTINKGLDISGQTKNFVVLTALPPLKKNEILEIVYKTLQTRGARIVSKLLDVYLPVDSDDVSMGYAVLFIEGWNIPQSEEDTTIVEEKKEGEAPPPPPEPPANDDRMWVCPVCTLHNQMSAHTCETCDSPRPPDPEIVGDLPPEVKAPEEGEAKVEEKVDPDTIRAKVWLSTLQSSLNKYIDERFAKETKEYEQKVAEIKQKEQKEKEDREKEQKEKEKQQKKKGGSSSQPESEVTSPDKPPEAPVFVAPTPLPQQPKKIDTTVVQMQQGKSVLESTECIEAILSRMVLDEFQQPLDKILESEYANRKAAIDSMFGVGDKDSFFSAVKDCEPIEIITNLQKLGLDFWLDKISQEEQANRPILEQIIKETISFVEKEICGESRFFSNFVSKDIRLIEQNPITKFRSSGFEDCIGYQAVPGFESKYPYLKTLSTSDLRIIWEKISQYNTLFIKLLPLINLSSQCNAKIGEEPVTLAGYISSLRYLCLSYVKSQAKTHIMEKTSLRGERTPSIKVERLTENSEDKNTEINSKEVSTSLWKQKNKFTFLRAFDQLKKIPVTLLRPEQEKGSGSFVAFKVDLEGENVQGLAGPYRQFFADISSELQPSITKNIARRTLGMFIPTPNAEHKFGEDRHKFTVNPSANSSYYLQLFETLGVLMGCALRTDSHFTLDLPNILWKRITGEDITMQDLELVDKHFVENLKYLENCTPATLEQMGIENFTTKLSDGSIVELMPNGEKTKVTFERIGEYRELCLKARLDECSKQVEAIKKGIFQIVPEPYFKIITCKDLETEICGTNQVDFKLLKKNTIYSGGLKEDSQLLKNFWQVLDDMKESDKLRFIKFCWGQERLPASDDDYKRTQTRFMIKPSMSSSTDHNSLLPKADTCFFNLELPHYTNKESMQEKILLAINFDCDSLNAEVAINELNENADNRGDDME
jgi:predicted DNA-binding ribbon-helix-helix protein